MFANLFNDEKPPLRIWTWEASENKQKPHWWVWLCWLGDVAVSVSMTVGGHWAQLHVQVDWTCKEHRQIQGPLRYKDLAGCHSITGQYRCPVFTHTPVCFKPCLSYLQSLKCKYCVISRMTRRDLTCLWLTRMVFKYFCSAFGWIHGQRAMEDMQSKVYLSCFTKTSKQSHFAMGSSW